MTVIDASVFVEALTNADALGTSARAHVAAAGACHAPAIFPAEVTSALRGLVVGGRLAEFRAASARRRLADTRVGLYPFAPFAERVWELRDRMTVYDAWYVALAEALDVTLVTSDGQLASAGGGRCQILLVTA